MKTTNDKYEVEIAQLKIENNRLKESTSDLQKTRDEQKEAYEFRILNGEKDIKDILSKISQIDGYIEANPGSLVGRDGSMGASNFIIEQLLKEKNEAERKYNDLFSLYNSLLDHNKILMGRFDQLKERDVGSRWGRAEDNFNLSSGKKDFKKYRQPEVDQELKQSLLTDSGTSATAATVGRIKKNNREKTKSESGMNYSYEEDKFSKSLAKSTDQSNLVASILLKPKNHEIYIDDLKNVR